MESHPFRFLRNLGRSREIATVLLNHGFGDLVDRLNLRRYLQWGRRLFRQKENEYLPRQTRAERFRHALEDLGPTYVKFGQIISTRPDLLPPDVIEEFTKLQEQVFPFPSAMAVQMLESEFGKPIDRLFMHFEREPLAAGSLAQVHRATLDDGTQVAVKIRRPNVIRDVERDLSLMMELAVLINRHIPEAAIFDPVGLVNYFARTIRRELNFNREARTLEEFAHNFSKDASLKVPAVYWEWSSESVLTMEFIDGYRVDDVDAIAALPISPTQIAANGSHIFMKMAFEIGVFHGDPHPGNMRILPDGTICLIDYGMIGVFEQEMRDNLVDLFVAVNKNNVPNAVAAILKLGQPFGEYDPLRLRTDVREFVENYYGYPLERINVGTMLTDFISILSLHAIRCPPDLMLLIRALISLEGVARQLDPNFNISTELAPFVRNVIKDRYNPQRMAQRFADEVRLFAQLAHDAPLHLGKTLEKLSKDDLKIQLDHRGLDHLITELDRSSNRIVVSLAMSSLIVASALLMRAGASSMWITLPIFLLSSLLGIWLIYGVFRSGRL
ncbi:MAG: AarF/ABC1/UbiB kinase family protein [Planctomycetota bacterium]|nr:AarF/ABC1/UbiB kinase family protein [Planctomycetota bacterium]MDA1213184.1 AarF/ABC1/UbiB kinase family protein [Planctomycetota bacterium]